MTHKSEEQQLFESKLLHDEYGIALRKIDRYGRAQLRYIKCVPLVSSQSGNTNANALTGHILSSNSRLKLGSRSAGGGDAVSNKFYRSHKSASAAHFYVSTLDDTQNLIASHDKESNSLIHSSYNSSNSHDYSPNRVEFSRSSYGLSWGKHCIIPLSAFQCVKLGRQTPRTRLSKADPTCLLSLCVKHNFNISSKSHNSTNSTSNTAIDNNKSEDYRSVLDIEAPTRLDRDLFAHAFAQFLGVNVMSFEVDFHHQQYGNNGSISSSSSTNDNNNNSKNANKQTYKEPQVDTSTEKSNAVKIKDRMLLRRSKTKTSPQRQHNAKTVAAVTAATTNISINDSNNVNITPPKSPDVIKSNSTVEVNDWKPIQQENRCNEVIHDNHNENVDDENEDEEASNISSITSHHHDNNVSTTLVDELHQIIVHLKHELHNARQEANRAVKVAEQAIQSAESVHAKSPNNSNNGTNNASAEKGDWNSTVTHQAAKAAALAQKKSAAALARARQAEEALAHERGTREALQQELNATRRDLRSSRIELAHQGGVTATTNTYINANNKLDEARLNFLLQEEIQWRRSLQKQVLSARGTGVVHCALYTDNNSDNKRMVQRVSPTLLRFEPSLEDETEEDLYHFDSIFELQQETKANEIYEETVHPMLLSALTEGYSSVYFTLSNTNSSGARLLLWDLSMLSLQRLFQDSSRDGTSCVDGIEESRQVEISVLRVHKERMYDLLATTSTTANTTIAKHQNHHKELPLDIRKNESGDISVHNLTVIPVMNEQKANQCIQTAMKRYMTEYEHTGHVLLSIAVRQSKQQQQKQCHEEEKHRHQQWIVGKMTFCHIQPPSPPPTSLIPVSASSEVMQDKSYQNMVHVLRCHHERTAANVRYLQSQYKSSENKVTSNMIPYRNATLTHLLKDVLHCGIEAMGTLSHDNENDDSTRNTPFSSSSSLGYLSASRPHAKLALLLLLSNTSNDNRPNSILNDDNNADHHVRTKERKQIMEWLKMSHHFQQLKCTYSTGM